MSKIALLLISVLFLSLSSPIYETEDPFNGVFGVYGIDVFQDQMVAVRFKAKKTHRLDRIKLWLWNNDLSGEEQKIYVSLRSSSARNKTPGIEIIEQWEFYVPFTGRFKPVLFTFESKVHPLIIKGKYWVAAVSEAIGRKSPVWAVAQPDRGFTAVGNPRTGAWSKGHKGNVVAIIVEGTRVGTREAVCLRLSETDGGDHLNNPSTHPAIILYNNTTHTSNDHSEDHTLLHPSSIDTGNLQYPNTLLHFQSCLSLIPDRPLPHR